MAVNTRFHLHGGKNLARTLAKASLDIQQLKDANKQAVNIVKPVAVARAPKRTGAMVKTARTSSTKKAGTFSMGNRKGGRVPYAAVINYGWPARGIQASLFAQLAAKITEPAWTANYTRFVNKVLSKVKGI